MSSQQTLSKRLLAIAQCVPEGCRVIDIGTDHAWLPIHLLRNKVVYQAIGVDQAEAPLQQAKRHRNKANISSEQLQLYQSNGLDTIPVRNGDVVTIAGMGGRSIIDIVSHPITKECSLLILQPNRNAAELRHFVSANGWRIDNEKIVFENNQFYPIICVSKGALTLTDKQCWLGPILQRERPPAYVNWLHAQLNVLQTVEQQAQGKMPETKRLALQWVQEELSC